MVFFVFVGGVNTGGKYVVAARPPNNSLHRQQHAIIINSEMKNRYRRRRVMFRVR
jgi:hypothetical protein